MARSINFYVEGDVNTSITVTELPGGRLLFTIAVLNSGLVGDLRALFFDLNDYVATSDLYLESADQVTGYESGEGSVDSLGGDANIRGSVSNELGDFDVGIEFGTSGMAGDDIQFASFVLGSTSGDLTLDMLNLADFGVRFTSVGEEGGDRTASLKIGDQSNGVAQNDLFTVDENESLPAGADLLDNDTNGATNVVQEVVASDGTTFTDTGSGFEIDVVIDGANLGILSIGTDGEISFSATGPDADSLAEGELASFGFQYETIALDGTLATADGTLEIIGVNDAPSAEDDGGLGAIEPVGGETQVNTETESFQSATAVAALNDGGYVVTWVSDGQDGSGAGVFAQRYDADGNPVGAEFQVNTETENDQQSPEVTGLADGGFVIVWESWAQDGSQNGVYGQRYDAAGNPVGGEFQVNTETEFRQELPSVAGLAGGGFVVTWQSFNQDGSSYAVMAQMYDASGAALGSEFQVNTTTTSIQYRPSVTALADGGFVIAWESNTQDGNEGEIAGQRYDAAGNPVGGEFQVSTTSAGEQQFPSTAALPDGGFVVTWEGPDGDGTGVFGQMYDAAGNPVGGEFQVNTETANNQLRPSVAATDDGGFVVTWMSLGQDGADYGVYGQRYDAAGTPVGDEFLVNTETNSAQAHPSVAVLTDGDIIVAWTSSVGDGDDSGIFSQRFTLGIETDEDTPIVIGETTLLKNDTDPDNGAQLSVVSVSGTSTLGATVTLNPDGSVTYDPGTSASLAALDDGESLVDTFTYTVADEYGATATATVSVTVNGADDILM